VQGLLPLIAASALNGTLEFGSNHQKPQQKTNLKRQPSK